MGYHDGMSKHFSTKRNELDFTIDDDQFFLNPVIPAGAMFQLTKLQGDMATASETGEGIDELILGIMEDLLAAESFLLFRKRFYGGELDKNGNIKRDPKIDPIDLEIFTEVTEWLIGESLGKDPTPEQSS